MILNQFFIKEFSDLLLVPNATVIVSGILSFLIMMNWVCNWMEELIWLIFYQSVEK